jgi:hypothetical protein
MTRHGSVGDFVEQSFARTPVYNVVEVEEMKMGGRHQMFADLAMAAAEGMPDISKVVAIAAKYVVSIEPPTRP